MSSYSLKGHEFPARKPDLGLYIAATPIGNLADITLRVLETLAGCDLIACEDTRVTGKLLKHYAISTPMISHHEHNAESSSVKIIEALQAGKSVCLVSDAGTPLVSDPGARLVKNVRHAGFDIYPLPGASAVLAALVASGLPAEKMAIQRFPSEQIRC